MIDTIYSNPSALMHYGVPGMRWGHRKTYNAVGTGLVVRRNQNGQPYVSPYRKVSTNTRVHGGGGGSFATQAKKDVGFEACKELIIKHKLRGLDSASNSRSAKKGEKTFNSWTDMVKV